VSKVLTALPVSASGCDSDDYAPSSYEPPPTIGERLVRGWTTITATPARSALATVGATSAVIGLVALRPVTAHATDSHGPLVAHCGLGYYVFGHPNPVVTQICGTTYAGRATVVLAASIVVVAAMAALFWTCRRASAPDSRAVRTVLSLAGTRGRAALMALAASALAVWLAALRTIPVHGQDALGPFTAHCGLSLYIFGDSSHVVQSSCRHAFAGHAEILLIAGCVFVVALAAEAILISTARRPASTDRPASIDDTKEMSIATVKRAEP
jgi:hypothetical protein